MNGLSTEHESAPFHRVHFDPASAGQPSSAIVSAIATVTDSPPRTIAPLYESIDLDALDRLLEHSSTVAAGTTPFALEFTVDGWDVVVTGCGEVLVYDAGEGAEPDSGIEFGVDR